MRPMAVRANWKGYFRIGELGCRVALFTAASTSDRVVFHIVNRRTGHLVHRAYVDGESGETVGHDAQVKGFEDASGAMIVLEPAEVAAAVPQSDKTLAVSGFVGCDEVDTIYLDKPYYLAPADRNDDDVYGLIRDGLRARNVAALARTVLFRRVRTLLIRPHGDGLIATTLNVDDEVRSAAEAFRDIPAPKVGKEMLDLARHIIETKRGDFDPAGYRDRYEAALAELVKAKLAGRKMTARTEPKQGKVVDLMAALRASAGGSGRKSNKSNKSNARTKAAPKRRAG